MTGPGWKTLIDPLIEQCKEEGVEIHQVKEKFGGLRFYVGHNASDRLNHMIANAEDKSFHVCERCGEPGKIRKDLSWLKTLCDKCNE